MREGPARHAVTKKSDEDRLAVLRRTLLERTVQSISCACSETKDGCLGKGKLVVLEIVR